MTSARGERDTDGSNTPSEPTVEEIRYRAYLLYVERGREHGMDFEDWVRAEQELRNRK